MKLGHKTPRPGGNKAADLSRTLAIVHTVPGKPDVGRQPVHGVTDPAQLELRGATAAGVARTYRIGVFDRVFKC